MHLAKLLARVERVLLVTTTILFMIIVVLALTQVFFRYVLDNALGWSAELTKIVFIWMTFLGSAVALNRRRHLRIDTLIRLLPPKVQVLVDILVHAVAILLLATLAVKGLELAQIAQFTRTSALRWPRSVLIFPVIIGSAFMLIFSVRCIAEDIQVLRNPELDDALKRAGEETR